MGKFSIVLSFENSVDETVLSCIFLRIRSTRKQNLKYVQKHKDIGSVRAGHWLVHYFGLNEVWFCELPDSASNEHCASTSESDSDVFDRGAFQDRRVVAQRRPSIDSTIGN